MYEYVELLEGFNIYKVDTINYGDKVIKYLPKSEGWDRK